MIELMEWKRCPFCGSTVSLAGIGREAFEDYMKQTGTSVLGVWCTNEECRAEMNYINKTTETYEEALRKMNEKWNRRTP